MNKTRKLLVLALNCLIVSPIVSVVISVGLVIPFIGIVFSIMAAIRIARFIEGNRKETFPDLNRFIFILCVYGPALAASVILWLVGSILPDRAGLVCVAAGFLAFVSQLILTITGTIITLRAPRISFLPRVQYRPDFPDPESFFDNNGG